MELYPGAEVASSVMTPIPTEWWLRPLSKAARVGAHSAVVWKRLYFRPFPASRSAVGVAHGPPNALDAVGVQVRRAALVDELTEHIDYTAAGDSAMSRAGHHHVP